MNLERKLSKEKSFKFLDLDLELVGPKLIGVKSNNL